MDSIAADLAIQAILAQGNGFAGIDNEALDISLEDYINQGNNSYTQYLNSSNVIVENNSNNVSGHSLPESPPDSSSEHPYSPQDPCETPLHISDNIYPLAPNFQYKTLINPGNPILGTENVILTSHIVLSEPNDTQLLEDGNILQDGRLLVNNNDMRNNSSLLDVRLLPESEPTLQNLLTQTETNRHLIQNNDDNQNYSDQNLFTTSNEEQLRYTHGIDEPLGRNTLQNNGLCDSNLQGYTNTTSTKKRKLSQDLPLIKSEPEHCTVSQLSSPRPCSVAIDNDTFSEAGLPESQYQCIRFSPFQQPQWHVLYDQNLVELQAPSYQVDADKGFNFSNADDAFVCQKKNHFQITCHVQLLGDAQFVKITNQFIKISSFYLHFYGVKHDCPTQTIKVEQSQSDRSKKPFNPVLVELVNSQVTKVTVGRLHFSETTSNNMRKKGKPNPEQRYFQLVVGLHAHTTDGNFPIISYASQKIIVRASNPGQFENDVDVNWNRGQSQDTICYHGKVGVNTDRPDESLVVHGNIRVTGQVLHQSDIRAKRNIIECNTSDLLNTIKKMRVVSYEYQPGFQSMLSPNRECSDTGVIAQEVAEILPDAVRSAGDLILDNGVVIDNFLVVNKERIFMENVGAVQELGKVTDNLKTRIEQLERINRKLNKLKRGDSWKSNSTMSSSTKTATTNKYNIKQRGTSCNTEEDELCSNKFIQIVIVVLVLIMALCLFAITTLYLIEAQRHTNFVQTALQNAPRSVVTKRPAKSKPHTWFTSIPHHTTNSYSRDDAIGKFWPDPLKLGSAAKDIIGMPQECLSVEQDLKSSNLCQIFCCSPPPVIAPQEIYPEKRPITLNRNRTTTTPLLNVEKNKIAKPFHSNDIDKQIRQRRDATEFTNDANTFDASEDQMFNLLVQGKNFNITLSPKYLSSVSQSANFSYSVPISKYMPDDYINLIFRSTQANIKEIEHCYNDNKQNECPYISPAYFEDKLQNRHKVNENSPIFHTSSQSVIFEVDMADFQYKIMTYRASLRQINQNSCKLSNTKLGLEFVEYNFYFYRHCEE